MSFQQFTGTATYLAAPELRDAVNVVPRDILGLPILTIAIPLSRLPPRLADALVAPILRAYYPVYGRLGLRKAAAGRTTLEEVVRAVGEEDAA